MMSALGLGALLESVIGGKVSPTIGLRPRLAAIFLQGRVRSG
jgi:hypothetical protein